MTITMMLIEFFFFLIIHTPFSSIWTIYTHRSLAVAVSHRAVIYSRYIQDHAWAQRVRLPLRKHKAALYELESVKYWFGECGCLSSEIKAATVRMPIAQTFPPILHERTKDIGKTCDVIKAICFPQTLRCLKQLCPKSDASISTFKCSTL